MKIAVLDGYAENPGDLSWEPIRAFGEVTVYDRVSYEESPAIAKAIGDAEIVVLNKTPVSRETIDRCPDIRMKNSNGSISGSIEGSLSDYRIDSGTVNGRNSLPKKYDGHKTLNVHTMNGSINVSFLLP